MIQKEFEQIATFRERVDKQLRRLFVQIPDTIDFLKKIGACGKSNHSRQVRSGAWMHGKTESS